MGMVIDNEIRIEGAFALETLLDFTMDIVPNCHGKAMIKGIFTDVEEIERWQQTAQRHEILIYSHADDKPVFGGILDHAVWKYESGLYTAVLDVITASIELDIKKESASFQNISMTYEEILEKSFASVTGAGCMCVEGKGDGPGAPLIQYQETDWEFAMRLAGRLHTVIYPDITGTMPSVWLGIPDRGHVTVMPHASDYVHEIRSGWCNESADGIEGNRQGYFEYYRIETGEDYDIGEKAVFAGRTWTIIEKHAGLVRGEIRYTYVMGKNPIAASPKYYQELFAGMSISGTVIKTDGERVKLHLAIDGEQSADTAYPYPWVPDTGSVMYCMPEVGSTVSLYFPDADERNAVAVSCVRHNGAACPEMEDMQKRTLTTAVGKRMYMNPDEAGFDIRESGHQMMLKDDTGICLESSKMLQIAAAQGIQLKADTVIMETPGEINLMRGQMGKIF